MSKYYEGENAGLVSSPGIIFFVVLIIILLNDWLIYANLEILD